MLTCCLYRFCRHFKVYLTEWVETGIGPDSLKCYLQCSFLIESANFFFSLFMRAFLSFIKQTVIQIPTSLYKLGKDKYLSKFTTFYYILIYHTSRFRLFISGTCRHDDQLIFYRSPVYSEPFHFILSFNSHRYFNALSKFVV